MNILLIMPPMTTPNPAKSTLLGLGYIASVLRNKKHNVKIIDLTLKKDMIEIRSNKFETLGVSCMFTEFKEEAKNLLYQARAIFKDIHIIVGGAHASTFPEEMIEYADTVVVGEGEEVICDIVENRRKGIIRAERIRNLDNLPMPAWDLMMLDIMEINQLSAKSPFLMRRPLVHIITSRGCPNQCSYCAVKVAWGRQWYARSAGNVVDEIEYLYKLGFREIHFNDDNCSIDKNRMYAICEEILMRNINIKLACPTGIHIGTLDKPLLKLMKKAGFYRLCFGIETGNQEMQAKIKKNINLDKARQVIKDANDLGYWTAATFICGFPGTEEESLKDRNDTVKFIEKTGLDFPIFYQLQLQPKTELYERWVKKEFGVAYPNAYQRVISKHYKFFIYYKINNYINSFINIVKKIHSWEDIRYAWGLIKFALTKIVFKPRVNNETIRGR